MEQLKIDYKFNLKDFKIMEDIEHSYFPNENITEAEEVMKCIPMRMELFYEQFDK